MSKNGNQETKKKEMEGTYQRSKSDLGEICRAPEEVDELKHVSKQVSSH